MVNLHMETRDTDSHDSGLLLVAVQEETTINSFSKGSEDGRPFLFEVKKRHYNVF